MLDSLDDKILRIFGDLAVDKRLTRLDVVSRLPKFIAEYLISKYYRSDPNTWLEKLTRIVNEFFPDPKDREKVLSKAVHEGKVTLIDEYEAYVDLKLGLYFLRIPNLQINDALVDQALVRKYDRLFNGVWGIGVLRYRPDIVDSSKANKWGKIPTPLQLVEFEPFQAYNVDLRSFIEARHHFTYSEWIDMLIKSIGLNPNMYAHRQKLLLLVRLVPLIEGNVNILELGPRATGKTYLYRNISYYTRIYAGGIVSAARLFFDARLKILGDIGQRDAVIFDEIARVKFTNPDEVVAKLKDYMVDGFFERGPLKRAHSTCSLVFIGNIELVSYSTPDNIISYLPDFLKDTAMLDRIHGLLPGWELPKIQKSDIHLAQGYGLASDYLSEILHKMRDISFEALVEQHFEFGSNFTIRDEKAVKKLLSGLLKVLFPHGSFDKKELAEIAELAAELRQNVVNILSVLSPAEFPRKSLIIRVRG
jgi:ATP-dependent Lon protease